MRADDPSAREAFDLEAAIGAWRLHAAAGGASDAVLDELEDHLRLDYAARAGAELDGAKAWAATVAALGDQAAIGREFGKLDRLPMIDRLALGALLGVAALAGTVALAAIAARGPEVVQRPVLTLHVVAVTWGYLAGLLAAAAAAYATVRTLATRSTAPKLRDASLQVVRVASVGAVVLSSVGFLLGAAWARDALGRAFTADPREIGALLVVACFAGAAVAAFTRASRVAPTIAIAGGGAVLAAWFGVAAFAGGFPALLTTVGIGGATACLLLAGLSLRSTTISR